MIINGKELEENIKTVEMGLEHLNLNEKILVINTVKDRIEKSLRQTQHTDIVDKTITNMGMGGLLKNFRKSKTDEEDEQ